MIKTLLLIVVGCAIVVNCISFCILGCAVAGSGSTGCSYMDQCACTNTEYQDKVNECINSKCPGDMEEAKQLQQQHCG
ncbi:hypothetical protein BC940DRAFT_287014 [Gongronella butleri]|nr:hypothetical protein BC940DRAFT_287014 [Gongronella butleri]